jgi:hypothetical protein
MLCRTMLGIEDIKGERNALPYLIHTHAFLACTLQNIGAEDEAATQCVFYKIAFCLGLIHAPCDQQKVVDHLVLQEPVSDGRKRAAASSSPRQAGVGESGRRELVEELEGEFKN